MLSSFFKKPTTDVTSKTQYSLLISDLMKVEHSSSSVPILPSSVTSSSTVSILADLVSTEFSSFISSSPFDHNPAHVYTALLGFLKAPLNVKPLVTCGIPTICCYRLVLSANRHDSSCIPSLIFQVISRCAVLFPSDTFSQLYDFSLVSSFPLLSSLSSSHLEFIQSSALTHLFLVCNSQFSDPLMMLKDNNYRLCVVLFFKLILFLSNSILGGVSFSTSKYGISNQEISSVITKFITYHVKILNENFNSTVFVHGLVTIIAVLFSNPGILAQNLDSNLIDLLSDVSFSLANLETELSTFPIPSIKESHRLITSLAMNDNPDFPFPCPLFMISSLCLASLAVISVSDSNSNTSGCLHNTSVLVALSSMFSNGSKIKNINVMISYKVMAVKLIHAILDAHSTNFFTASFTCSRATSFIFSQFLEVSNHPYLVKAILSLLMSICRSSAGFFDLDGRMKSKSDVPITGMAEFTALSSILTSINSDFDRYNNDTSFDLFSELFSSINDSIKTFSENSLHQFSLVLAESAFIHQSMILFSSLYELAYTFKKKHANLSTSAVNLYQNLTKFLTNLARSDVGLALIFQDDCSFILSSIFLSNHVIATSSATLVKGILLRSATWVKNSHFSLTLTDFLDRLISLVEAVDQIQSKHASTLILFLTQSVQSTTKVSPSLVEGIKCSFCLKRLLILFLSCYYLSDSASLCLSALLENIPEAHNWLTFVDFVSFYCTSEIIDTCNSQEFSKFWTVFLESTSNSQSALLKILRISTAKPNYSPQNFAAPYLTAGSFFCSLFNFSCEFIQSQSKVLPFLEDLIDATSSLAHRPSNALLFCNFGVIHQAIRLLTFIYDPPRDLSNLIDSDFDLLISLLETLIVRVLNVYSTPCAIKLITDSILPIGSRVRSKFLPILSSLTSLVPPFLFENGTVLLTDPNDEMSSFFSPKPTIKRDGSSMTFTCWFKFLHFQSDFQLFSFSNQIFSLQVNANQLFLTFSDSSSSHSLSITDLTPFISVLSNSWCFFGFSLTKYRLSYKIQSVFNSETISHVISSNFGRNILRILNSDDENLKFLTISTNVALGYTSFYPSCLPLSSILSIYDSSQFLPIPVSLSLETIASDGMGLVPSLVGGITAHVASRHHCHVYSPEKSSEKLTLFEPFLHTSCSSSSFISTLSFSSSLASLFQINGLEMFCHLFSVCCSTVELKFAISLLVSCAKDPIFLSSLHSLSTFNMSSCGLSLLFSSLNNVSRSFSLFDDSCLTLLMSVIGFESNFNRQIFDAFVNSLLILYSFSPKLVSTFFKILTRNFKFLGETFGMILSFVAKTKLSDSILDDIRAFFDKLLTNHDYSTVKLRFLDTISVLNVTIPLLLFDLSLANISDQNLLFSTVSCPGVNLIIYVLQKLAHISLEKFNQNFTDLIKPSFIFPFLDLSRSNLTVSIALIRIILDFSCSSSEFYKLSRDSDIWPVFLTYCTSLPASAASRLLLYTTANAIGFPSFSLPINFHGDVIITSSLISSIKNDLISYLKNKNQEFTPSPANSRCWVLSILLLKSAVRGNRTDVETSELMLDVLIHYLSQRLPPSTCPPFSTLSSLGKRIESLSGYLGELVVQTDTEQVLGSILGDGQFSVEAVLMEEYDVDVGIMEPTVTTITTPDLTGFNQFSTINIDEEIDRFPVESPYNSEDEEERQSFGTFSDFSLLSSSLSVSIVRLSASCLCLQVLIGDVDRAKNSAIMILPSNRSIISHKFSSIFTMIVSLSTHLSSHLSSFLSSMSWSPSILSSLNSVLSVICSRVLFLIKLGVDADRSFASGVEISVWCLSWLLGIFNSFNRSISHRIWKSGIFSDTLTFIPLFLSYGSCDPGSEKLEINQLLGGIIHKNLYLFLITPEDKIVKQINRMILCMTLPSLLNLDQLKSPKFYSKISNDQSSGWTFEESVKIWKKMMEFSPSSVIPFIDATAPLFRSRDEDSSKIGSKSIRNETTSGFFLLTFELSSNFRTWVLSEGEALKELVFPVAHVMTRSILEDCLKFSRNISDVFSIIRNKIANDTSHRRIFSGTIKSSLAKSRGNILKNKYLVKKICNNLIKTQFESMSCWRYLWSLHHFDSRSVSFLTGYKQSRHLSSHLTRSNITTDYAYLSKFPPLPTDPDHDSVDEELNSALSVSRNLPVSRSATTLSSSCFLQALFSSNSAPSSFSPSLSSLSSISSLETLICDNGETIEQLCHCGLLINTLDPISALLVVTATSVHVILKTCINRQLLQSLSSNADVSEGQKLAQKLGTFPPTFFNPPEAPDLSLAFSSHSADILFRLTQRLIINRSSIINIFDRASAHEQIGLEIFVSTLINIPGVLAGGVGKLDSIFLLFQSENVRNSIHKMLKKDSNVEKAVVGTFSSGNFGVSAREVLFS
ncbi:hypothetical protein RCL1_008493 [Eukaryota sp. TZLM3-RCL]